MGTPAGWSLAEWAARVTVRHVHDDWTVAKPREECQPFTHTFVPPTDPKTAKLQERIGGQIARALKPKRGRKSTTTTKKEAVVTQTITKPEVKLTEGELRGLDILDAADDTEQYGIRSKTWNGPSHVQYAVADRLVEKGLARYPGGSGPQIEITPAGIEALAVAKHGDLVEGGPKADSVILVDGVKVAEVAHVDLAGDEEGEAWDEATEARAARAQNGTSPLKRTPAKRPSSIQTVGEQRVARAKAAEAKDEPVDPGLDKVKGKLTVSQASDVNTVCGWVLSKDALKREKRPTPDEFRAALARLAQASHNGLRAGLSGRDVMEAGLRRVM